jgi:glycosyltransferase involved in cell wall biosynthesis
MPVSICAVITTRNEALHLRRVLAELDAQDIDVALLDHGSEDDTGEVLAAFRHRVVLHQRREFEGEFSIGWQLRWKAEAIAALAHDWVVNHDSDESLRHADSRATLRTAIEQADASGHTALDFNEFVFLPPPGSRGRPTDFLANVHGYYFHAPMPDRLHRAWRLHAGLQWDDSSGGHRLSGPELRCAPQQHQLRHYIGMSEQHLQDKYVQRRVADSDLQRGWQTNRMGLSARDLCIPSTAPWLLPWRGDDAPLRTDVPASKHYWHWPRGES